MDGEDELRIVLLGKTGVGKSAFGNAILGEDRFTAECSQKSVTQICQRAEKVINGRRIVVIDTPGIFDTDRPEEELKEEVISCLVECAPGPHVFILVLKIERHTKENQQTVEKILEYFSDDCFPHVIILFTHGDDLDENMEILDFINQSADKKNKSEKYSLQDVIKKCGNRVHVIDNKHWKTDLNSTYSDLIARLKQLNLPEEDIRNITEKMQKTPAEQTPWFSELSEYHDESKEQDMKEYRSNRFQFTQLMKSINNIMSESKGKPYSNKALEEIGKAINVEVENILKERGVEREKADMVEIKEEAKERVRNKLGKKLVGIAVGTLLGVLLGVGVGILTPIVMAAGLTKGMLKYVSEYKFPQAEGESANTVQEKFSKVYSGTAVSVAGAVTTGIATGLGATLGAGGGIILGAVLGGASGCEESKKAYTSSQAAKNTSKAAFQNAGEFLKDLWHASSTAYENEPLKKND